MTLPASGVISLGNDTGDTTTQSVNRELGKASPYQQTISLNDAAVRTLFGIASGTIDMNTGHGKANRVALAYTYSANTANASLNVTTLGGYVAGKSDITITVNTGIYVYSTNTANAGLTLTGTLTAGDTVTLVNNGYIMGMGGSSTWAAPAGNGGPAISLGMSVSITNNSYIGGGGGSGYIGGGGAGGGNGFSGMYSNSQAFPADTFITLTGTGGAVGASGANGNGWVGLTGGLGGGAGGGSGAYTYSEIFHGPYVIGSQSSLAGGGGGGRIFPGTGGAGGTQSGGGYAGGAGGAGGSAGGNSADILWNQSGGGGGWGAAGGGNPGGGAGGKCVALNGNTVTWNTVGTRYGAIS